MFPVSAEKGDVPLSVQRMLFFCLRAIVADGVVGREWCRSYLFVSFAVSVQQFDLQEVGVERMVVFSYLFVSFAVSV